VTCPWPGIYHTVVQLKRVNDEGSKEACALEFCPAPQGGGLTSQWEEGGETDKHPTPPCLRIVIGKNEVVRAKARYEKAGTRCWGTTRGVGGRRCFL